MLRNDNSTSAAQPDLRLIIAQQLPDEIALHPDYVWEVVGPGVGEGAVLRHHSGVHLLVFNVHANDISVYNCATQKITIYELAAPDLMDKLQAACSTAINEHQAWWHKPVARTEV